MNADNYTLKARQGTKFEIIVDRKDSAGAYRDFSTDTIAGQIRTAANSSEVVASFVCDVITHPITEDESTAIRISLGATVTETLAPSDYVYDITVQPASGEDDTFLLLAGYIKVSAGVTR